ncbi:MAG: hypothetical protein IPL32_17775 [Chloracidobacterium sp.]|nr:hypothetical protein [Chloracidobacterium sp.]
MKLLVQRELFSDKTSIGTMYVDGVRECYTLEDRDRHLEEGGEKVYGETAIPRNTYKVVITYSNRFKQPMPLLVDVPQFEGIRIHPGNTAEDTHGCILVGVGIGNDRLYNSRQAYERLFNKLEAAEALGEEITIEIR